MNVLWARPAAGTPLVARMLEHLRSASVFNARRLHMAQTLAAQAEAENTQLRRDLIANVSHDLRTPLVSLHGYLEMMVTKGDALAGAQRAEFLEVALRQSKNLGRLIDELFDLAKLDFKGMVLQREPFALADLAADVLQKFQLHADEHSVRLQLDAAPGLPFVDADLGLIERVLDNLIGNALKHTPAGGRVCVALHAAQGHLQVRVRDSGCGIAADELPFVFDRFYRCGNHARAAGGAGLGLAITRRIIELHGSRIDVTSQRGEGAHFMFALPLATAAAAG